MAKKWVYLFNEVHLVEKHVNGHWEGVRGLLGGKGANLAEMVRIGVPVPPGFTVTTEACNAYLKSESIFSDEIWDQEVQALRVVEKETGKKFGSADNPLLVSCRSGAKFSMPGMMDTVLNIGLNDETAQGMTRNGSTGEKIIEGDYLTNVSCSPFRVPIARLAAAHAAIK